MAAIVAFAVLIRLPFLSFAGTDEAFYLVIGRQWLEGSPPYAGSFDVKPPLLFALMAGAEALFGPNLLAAKVLTMTAVSAAACGLFLFGRRFIGELTGIAAAFFYIIATLDLGGAYSPAELIMAPFTAFGMLIGLSAAFGRVRRELPALLAAGCCFGAAACIKQTAVFEAAALAAFLLSGGSVSAGLKRIGLFAAGFCIVPAAFALYFLAIGHLDAMIADVAATAVRRANAGYISGTGVLMRLLAAMMVELPVVALALLLWAERRPLRSHPAYPTLRFLAAWTGGSLLGVLAGKAMCFFYFFTVVQPLSLASGAFFQYVIGRLRRPSLKFAVRSAVMAAAVIFFAAPAADFVSHQEASLIAAEAAAAAMRDAGQRNGDRILVADRDVVVYLTSGANPATSVFHPIQLLCDFPGAASAMAKSLGQHPAFVIAADPPLHLICEQPETRALLETTLERDYRLIGRFGKDGSDGQSGVFAVYGLKERQAANAKARASQAD
jgi:4-amino-4-deoxy-L-arabinose transferase-like glycosyltransferase